MIHALHLQKSNMGSVVYVDGEFFTSDWTSVFVPLNEADKNQFINKVNSTERSKGRRLRLNELLDILQRA